MADENQQQDQQDQPFSAHGAAMEFGGLSVAGGKGVQKAYTSAIKRSNKVNGQASNGIDRARQVGSNESAQADIEDAKEKLAKAKLEASKAGGSKSWFGRDKVRSAERTLEKVERVGAKSTKTAEKVFASMESWGGAAKAVGRKWWIVALVLGAIDTGIAAYNGGPKAAAAVGTDTAALLGGALAGGKIGASIGAYGGPWGALAGGVIGGVIGMGLTSKYALPYVHNFEEWMTWKPDRSSEGSVIADKVEDAGKFAFNHTVAPILPGAPSDGSAPTTDSKPAVSETQKTLQDRMQPVGVPNNPFIKMLQGVGETGYEGAGGVNTKTVFFAPKNPANPDGEYIEIARVPLADGSSWVQAARAGNPQALNQFAQWQSVAQAAAASGQQSGPQQRSAQQQPSQAIVNQVPTANAPMGSYGPSAAPVGTLRNQQSQITDPNVIAANNAAWAARQPPAASFEQRAGLAAAVMAPPASAGQPEPVIHGPQDIYNAWQRKLGRPEVPEQTIGNSNAKFANLDDRSIRVTAYNAQGSAYDEKGLPNSVVLPESTAKALIGDIEKNPTQAERLINEADRLQRDFTEGTRARSQMRAQQASSKTSKSTGREVVGAGVTFGGITY